MSKIKSTVAPAIWLCSAMLQVGGLIGMFWGLLIIGNPEWRLSNVTVDGKRLTVSEVHQSFKEVARMVDHVKANGTNSVNLSIRPTTPLSKIYWDFFNDIKQLDSDYQAEGSSVDVSELLVPTALASPSGRETSLRNIDRLEKIEFSFFTRRSEIVDRFFTTMKAILPGSIDEAVLGTVREQTEKERDWTTSLCNVLRRVINHVAKSQVSLEDGHLAFYDAKALGQFRALMDQLESQQKAFDKFQAEVIASRQKLIDKSLVDLRG